MAVKDVTVEVDYLELALEMAVRRPDVALALLNAVRANKSLPAYYDRSYTVAHDPGRHREELEAVKAALTNAAA